VVLDTEMTSLDRTSNRLLSVGAIVMEEGRICLGQQLYCVVDPGVPVPSETILIHRLRPTDIAGGEAPAQAVRQLMEFARGAVLVGHFLDFDRAVLIKELQKAAPPLAGQSARAAVLDYPAIDTARVQRWLDLRKAAYSEDRGHDTQPVDLASLAKRYGLEQAEAHHALSDALLTAQLWQRLIHALQRAGITTLRQALRIGRPR
jgi:DNA polymerase-3 subunit epsilon